MDINPAFWRARVKRRWRLELGIDVRPNRAFEALVRWEQTWERFTRDMAGIKVPPGLSVIC